MSDTYILTLVASDTPLSDSLLGGVDVILTEHNLQETAPRIWLSDKKALDIKISSPPDTSFMTAIRELLYHVRVDHFVTLDNKYRRKKLLMADMDSTIVDGETLDEVAAEFGLRLMVAAITERAMRGELNFKTSLRERVALLAGKPRDALQKIREETHLNPGARTLVETMRHHGAMCVLISGGFTYFTSYIAEQCHFHHHHGNNMAFKNGKITGFLEDPVSDQDAKLVFMNEYVLKKRVTSEQVLAIGDGANDRAMIESAGLGIGYHPHPVVEEVTHNIIRYGDLTASLFAQGYTKEEFKYPASRT